MSSHVYNRIKWDNFGPPVIQYGFLCESCF